jgi:hypothetical protein
MLLQVDTSRHDWLEGRGSHLTPVGAKDDATGEIWAQFCEAETCWAYLWLMRAIWLSTGCRWRSTVTATPSSTARARLRIERQRASSRIGSSSSCACLPDYNRRFRVAPREQLVVWRKAPSAQQLDRLLYLKEWRVVGRDLTVSFDGLVLQLTSGRKFFSLARRRVEVLQLRDDGVEAHHEQRMVTRFTAPVTARLVRKSATAKKRVA